MSSAVKINKGTIHILVFLYFTHNILAVMVKALSDASVPNTTCSSCWGVPLTPLVYWSVASRSFTAHHVASFAFTFVFYLMESRHCQLIRCLRRAGPRLPQADLNTLTQRHAHTPVQRLNRSIWVYMSLFECCFVISRSHRNTHADGLRRWIVWGRYRAGAARLSGRTGLTAALMQHVCVCVWWRACVCVQNKSR